MTSQIDFFCQIIDRISQKKWTIFNNILFNYSSHFPMSNLFVFNNRTNTSLKNQSNQYSIQTSLVCPRRFNWFDLRRKDHIIDVHIEQIVLCIISFSCRLTFSRLYSIDDCVDKRSFKTRSNVQISSSFFDRSLIIEMNECQIIDDWLRLEFNSSIHWLIRKIFFKSARIENTHEKWIDWIRMLFDDLVVRWRSRIEFGWRLMIRKEENVRQ